MDIKGTQRDDVDWLHLAQSPVAGFCEHGNEPSVYIKDGEFPD
jgi:hypothetical protein